MSPSQPARKRLPVKPSEEHLKKQAKRRAKLNGVPLAEAQHHLAQEYGSRNWAELMHIVETMRRGADQMMNVQYVMEALPKAANSSDIEKVREILASGGFTQHDLDLALARSLCNFKNSAPIAQLLLDHGADPDGQYGSDYGPVIFVTGETLDVDALQFLIDAGADVTAPPIDTKYGRQCLLSYWLGAYVRGRNDVKHRGIELLLARGAFVPPEVPPELLAIHCGKAEALATMLDKDPSLVRRRYPDMPYGNIELRGATLLHAAVEFGETECINALFDRHADINAPADLIDGVGGQTPIFHAINTNSDGNFYTLQHLIRRVGQWIDMSVRATWRGSGGSAILNFDSTTTPLTPLEYGETVARDIDPRHAHFRTRAADELALLRSLDRRDRIKRACRAGDVAAVSTLLDESPDLLTPELWPPTIFEAKSLELTQLLLDRGLDPNQCSAPRKPLHLAADRGRLDIVALLLSRGAKVNVVDGENITPYELLCCGLASPPNVEELRQALRDAGAADTVFTHLYLRHDDAAIALLQADSSLVTTRGPISFTPLQTAARAARPAVVKALLERVAAPESPDDRNTPLWLACQSNAPADDRLAVATLLIDAGAHLQRLCENQSTALHFAAWRGPIAMVELLLRRGAKEWVRDRAGKSPLDYAASGVAPDRDAIVELLTRPVIRDPHFKAAVTAIHAGDIETLRALLAAHPSLVHDRAMEPDCYPVTYFSNPKLVWFVANNPTLMETMPRNLPEITQLLIGAGAEVADLNYTLELVMTSDPAAAAGLQLPLMRTLLAGGATVTDSAVHATLGHGLALAGPIEVLLAGGLPLTAPIAAGLGRLEDLQRLLVDADADTLHAALSLAVINRHDNCAAACLAAGADANCLVLVHTHSTPAHQATANNDVPTLRILAAHGARFDLKDTLWHGTPLGWAIHTKQPDAEAFLRSINAP